MRRLILATSLLCVAGAAYAIEPGQWQSSTQMQDITLPPSVPAQARDIMRQAMGQATTVTTCITQDDIDNSPQRMFEDTNGECRYTDFNMGGGKLDATAQCKTGGGNMNMTMSGTYTASTYDLTMSMQGDSGMGPMTMTFKTTGKRVGACS